MMTKAQAQILEKEEVLVLHKHLRPYLSSVFPNVFHHALERYPNTFEGTIHFLNNFSSHQTRERMFNHKGSGFLYYTCHGCFHPMARDVKTSSMVCKSCGLSRHILETELVSYNTRSNYNTVRHIYSSLEHFTQYVGDVTCFNQRILPEELVAFVRRHCEQHGSNDIHTIFRAIKYFGTPGYYVLRWQIQSVILGKSGNMYPFEWHQRIIERYKQLHARIIHKSAEMYNARPTSKQSRKQRVRIFFVCRYILYKICQDLGFDPLLDVIPKVKSKTLFETYERHWNDVVA